MNKELPPTFPYPKETKTVDFKILCDALTGKESATGELAKDICAMANNGSRSHLIIGLSDDGKNHRPVDNTKLTDDGLQTFIKTAITPIPIVSVSDRTFLLHGAEVVLRVIEVEGGAKRPYCLAKDFISYSDKVVLRRNDVWIRRGSTSDLATPMETIGMFSQVIQRRIARTDEAARKYQLLNGSRRRQAILEAVCGALASAGFAKRIQDNYTKKPSLRDEPWLFTNSGKGVDTQVGLNLFDPTVPFPYNLMSIGLLSSTTTDLIHGYEAKPKIRHRTLRTISLIFTERSFDFLKAARYCGRSLTQICHGHYYMEAGHIQNYTRSTRELFVIDRVKSEQDARVRVLEFVQSADFSSAVQLRVPNKWEFRRATRKQR